MRIVISAFLVVAACFAAASAARETCTPQAPWDDARRSLEEATHDPGFFAVGSIDEGKLLAAMKAWFDARARGDERRLADLTIPLPDDYARVNRDWIRSDMRGPKYDVARPLLAQVDRSNPFHAQVFSEVTIVVAGKCVMSTMAGDWVKLNGEWRAFPGGVTAVH